jgi:hypothetical protein
VVRIHITNIYYTRRQAPRESISGILGIIRDDTHDVGKDEHPLLDHELLDHSKLKRLLTFILSPLELQSAILQLRNRSLVKHQNQLGTFVLAYTRPCQDHRTRARNDKQDGSSTDLSVVCWAQCEIFITHLQLLRCGMKRAAGTSFFSDGNCVVLAELWPIRGS